MCGDMCGDMGEVHTFGKGWFTGVFTKGGFTGGSRKGGSQGVHKKGVHVNPMNPPGYGLEKQ